MTLKPINPSSRFFGFNIIEDPNMTTTVVDWSLCRSPSRAMRRVSGGRAILHRTFPETKAALLAML